MAGRQAGRRVADPWLAPGPVDPIRACEHTPEQTYTRQACSCGRSLWPVKGRGQGRSRLSPERDRALWRAMRAYALRGAAFYDDMTEAWRLMLEEDELHFHTWQQIAEKLGYRSRQAAQKAAARYSARHIQGHYPPWLYPETWARLR